MRRGRHGKAGPQRFQRTARPGIWVPPLEALAGTPSALQLPCRRAFRSRKIRSESWPTTPPIPDGGNPSRLRAKLRQAGRWATRWSSRLQHLRPSRQWGFEMGPQPTLPGWRSTIARATMLKVIAGLYALIRSGRHNVVIDGFCNTVGHLRRRLSTCSASATTQRHQWERTRAWA